MGAISNLRTEKMIGFDVHKYNYQDQEFKTIINYLDLDRNNFVHVYTFFETPHGTIKGVQKATPEFLKTIEHEITAFEIFADNALRTYEFLKNKHKWQIKTPN